MLKQTADPNVKSMNDHERKAIYMSLWRDIVQIIKAFEMVSK